MFKTKMYLNNNHVIIYTFFDLNCLSYGYLFQYYICIKIHLNILIQFIYHLKL